jgi:hypothetical protein
MDASRTTRPGRFVGVGSGACILRDAPLRGAPQDEGTLNATLKGTSSNNAPTFGRGRAPAAITSRHSSQSYKVRPRRVPAWPSSQNDRVTPRKLQVRQHRHHGRREEPLIRFEHPDHQSSVNEPRRFPPSDGALVCTRHRQLLPTQSGNRAAGSRLPRASLRGAKRRSNPAAREAPNKKAQLSPAIRLF